MYTVRRFECPEKTHSNSTTALPTISLRVQNSKQYAYTNKIIVQTARGVSRQPLASAALFLKTFRRSWDNARSM